jgi:hypothetical protein
MHLPPLCGLPKYPSAHLSQFAPECHKNTTSLLENSTFAFEQETFRVVKAEQKFPSPARG